LAGNVLGNSENNFVVAEWRDPGGRTDSRRPIAPRHVHRSDDEAWYVLEGSLSVEVGSEEVHVPAGSGVLVPRGTSHTYWNSSSAPARYLLIMTPNIFALIQGIHALKERTPTALNALFLKHDSELLNP
jgi:uncharacterized cupin superfamily protein